MRLVDHTHPPCQGTVVVPLGGPGVDVPLPHNPVGQDPVIPTAAEEVLVHRVPRDSEDVLPMAGEGVQLLHLADVEELDGGILAARQQPEIGRIPPHTKDGPCVPQKTGHTITGARVPENDVLVLAPRGEEGLCRVPVAGGHVPLVPLQLMVHLGSLHVQQPHLPVFSRTDKLRPGRRKGDLADACLLLRNGERLQAIHVACPVLHLPPLVGRYHEVGCCVPLHAGYPRVLVPWAPHFRCHRRPMPQRELPLRVPCDDTTPFGGPTQGGEHGTLGARFVGRLTRFDVVNGVEKFWSDGGNGALCVNRAVRDILRVVLVRLHCQVVVLRAEGTVNNICDDHSERIDGLLSDPPLGLVFSIVVLPRLPEYHGSHTLASGAG
eukprot:Sspe_Gene.67193::Locus_39673_Transcript_2_2_Confidence_0.667_Length_1534::g.67193::m.67193